MRFDAFYRTALFFTWFIMIFSVTVESASRELQSDLGFSHSLFSSPFMNAENDNLRTALYKFNDDVEDKPVRGYRSGFDESSSNKPIALVEQNDLDLSTTEGIKAYLRPLRAHVSPKTFELLTCDVLSAPDAFQYLIHTTMNINSRDIPKITSELRYVLSSNTLPESYIPYVEAMRSVLSGQIALSGAKRDIQEIQDNRPTNQNGRFSIPSAVSSPSELSDSGLFSSEIVSDPEPPLRLINKVLQIPKRNIPNLMARLEKFEKRVNKPNTYIRRDWWPYIWYANSLMSFFRSEFYLDDLKRDRDNLLRTSNFAKNPVSKDTNKNETN